MFFFGLFSTHLPYILVGVIYFASFAFASVQALKADAVGENSEGKKLEIQLPQDYLVHNIVSISDLSTNHDCCLGNDQSFKALPLATGEIKFYSCFDPPGSSLNTRDLFVRPPPVKS